MVGIYKITSPTGRVYVGQSWNIENRRTQHARTDKRTHNYILAKSIKKYGWDAHIFEVIMSLPENTTQMQLDQCEIDCIESCRMFGFKLMNLKEGGSKGKHCAESIARMTGIKRSEDCKEKHRINATGKIFSEETREKLRIANIGKKLSEEHKAKIKESVNKFCKTDEYRLKQSISGKGKIRSDESKKRYSLASLGNTRSKGKPKSNRLLNDDQVREIREQSKVFVYGKQKELALKYGVSKNVIYHVVSNDSYKYVI